MNIKIQIFKAVVKEIKYLNHWFDETERKLIAFIIIVLSFMYDLKFYK